MTPRSCLPAIGLAFLLTGLAGCATTRPAGPAVPEAEAQARDAQRERRLRADTRWGLEGRIAVSTGEQGGSARIDWRQDGAAYQVDLSAPVTRQSWRLSADASGARLEGLEGGTRTGADAGELLRAATRWDIPVASLSDWLRALPTPGRPATRRFGPGGRLVQLAQDGWTIDYAWPVDPAADLPSRVEARRDPAKVRLVVDRWTDGTQ